MADPRRSPADPMTALAEGAAQLHEIYSELRRAGFDEEQALRLAKAVLLEPLRAAMAVCPHCGHTRDG